MIYPPRICPVCQALPRMPCVSRNGRTLWNYVHKARQGGS